MHDNIPGKESEPKYAPFHNTIRANNTIKWHLYIK